MARYRRLRDELAASLGADSGLVRRIDNRTPELLWVRGELGVRDLAGDVRGPKPQDTVHALTILHGAELTPSQFADVNRIFSLRLGPKDLAYSPGFRATLADYHRIQRALRGVFGGEQESERFTLRVAREVRSGRPFAESVEAAAAGMLRLDGPRPELAREMLALLDGVRLRDEQARVLGGLVGADLTRRDRRLNSYVALRELPNGSVWVNTTTATRAFAPGELTPRQVREVVGDRGRVIVEGPISRGVAEALNQAGVYFVRDAEHFLANPVPTPVSAVRLIMVAQRGTTARDRAANRHIYDLEPGDDLTRLERAIGTAEGLGAQIVSNRESLEAALKKAHSAGERPVVFFHNDDGEIRFADRTSIDLEELPRGVTRYAPILIGCSTFAEPDLFARTTTDLHVGPFVDAYRATAARLRKGALTDDELLNSLGREYAGAIRRRKLVVIFGLTAGAAGASAGGSLVAMLTASPSDDDKKEEAPGGDAGHGSTP